MVNKQWHVGTSGWSYKHWKDSFYPPKLRLANWFDYYTSRFDSSEINTSFYHLPKEQTVINWAAKAPKGFTFCPKLSRYITHMKKLRDVEEPLERFFTVFAPLYPFMGPVLIQLPPMLRYNAAVAESFFDLIRTRYSDQRFVLEVRHDTWMQEEAIRLLHHYQIGFVISQSFHFFPYAEWVTSKDVYLRFHGPKELYASGYSQEMLREYAIKCKKWINTGHTVWAYFNNDIHGYAFQDAQTLQGLLEV
ncbi:MAG TPA: DUF72 domain-containing protein [Flavisolibacter sp.]|nr:DUF72 domain-containing protein [Flavisolibacter sp.]